MPQWEPFGSQFPCGSPRAATSNNTKASHMKKTSKLSAFTLIELLIVIAIIGILAAMLFPMIASALDSAQGTQVANNGKQIVTAITSANIDRAANMRGEVWPNKGKYQDSNAYFAKLMGDGGKAILTGLSFSTFAGGGVDPAADMTEFKTKGNVWTMLAGIGACSDSRTPFLWTRNGGGITENDFGDSQTTEDDWSSKLTDGVKPFATSLVVMVSKGAAMFELKATDLSNKTFLGGTTNAATAIEVVKACGSEAGDTSESEF